MEQMDGGSVAVRGLSVVLSRVSRGGKVESSWEIVTGSEWCWGHGNTHEREHAHARARTSGVAMYLHCT